MPRNTLYVTGFSKECKAADLAPNFEKYGELVRLDIPPPRTDDGEKYAFVEYKDAESCKKALELDGKTLSYSLKDGLIVQVARSDPYNIRARSGYRGRGNYSYGIRGRGNYGLSRGGYSYSRGNYGFGYRGGYNLKPSYNEKDYKGRGSYGARRSDFVYRGYDDRDYRSGRILNSRDSGYKKEGDNLDVQDRDKPNKNHDTDDFVDHRRFRSLSRSPMKRRERSRSPEHSVVSTFSDNNELKTFDIGFFIPNITLLDENQNEINLNDVQKKNKYIIIFAYPKAFTGGCTKQVLGFEKNYFFFKENDTAIFGLSSDKPEAQLKFKTKHQLSYSLLSDPSKKLISMLGAKKHPNGIKRSHWVFADGVLVDKRIQVTPDISIIESKKYIEHLQKSTEEISQSQSDQL